MIPFPILCSDVQYNEGPVVIYVSKNPDVISVLVTSYAGHQGTSAIVLTPHPR